MVLRSENQRKIEESPYINQSLGPNRLLPVGSQFFFSVFFFAPIHRGNVVIPNRYVALHRYIRLEVTVRDHRTMNNCTYQLRVSAPREESLFWTPEPHWSHEGVLGKLAERIRGSRVLRRVLRVLFSERQPFRSRLATSLVRYQKWWEPGVGLKSPVDYSTA